MRCLLANASVAICVAGAVMLGFSSPARAASESDTTRPTDAPESIAKVLRVSRVNADRPGERLNLNHFIETGTITIFDFYSVYCGPCMFVAPYLERLAQKRAGIVVCKIDINRPGVQGIDWSSPIARQYHLDSIPHLKIFGVDGKLMFEGNAAWRQFVRWLHEEGLDS